MRRLLLWAPPVAYMALIFYSSAQPDPAPRLTALVWDKVLHFSGYALLAVLFCRALRGERIALYAAAILAVVLTSVYGATDEWHQAFTPNRTSDVHDWIADSTGAVLGAAVYALAAVSMASRRLRRLPRSPLDRSSRPPAPDAPSRRPSAAADR